MHNVVHRGRAASASIALVLQNAFQSWDGFLEWLPVGVYTCDRGGLLVQYNRAAADLWGRSPTPGDTQVQFCGAWRRYSPSGEALAPSETPVSEVLRTGEPVRDRETIIERPDGSRITVLANVDPMIGEDGRLAGAVSCFQDISARKQAEEALREREKRSHDLLQALPAAIYTTDAAGRITFYNRAAVDLWGREPAGDDAQWCGTWRLFWPDGEPLPHDQCPMAVALRENRPIRGGEAIAERPDGTRVPFIPYPTPLRDASGALVGAVNMLVDITERKQAEARQKLLIDELNHRVKNTLATVQSLASQTAREVPSPQAYRERLEGRLVALSRAHDQISRRNWEHADLMEIVTAGLAPFRADVGDRIKITGAATRLEPRAALTLAMVFHELATNAAKFGALSQPSGRLEVEWTTRQNGVGPMIHVSWRESGGPPVAPPTRRGFGTVMVERSIEVELGGSAELRFDPSGVRCEISAPLGQGGR